MQIIAEAVVGYHRKLVEGGISNEAAGQMAVAFHERLMAMMPVAEAKSGAIRRRDNR
jgi:hypothetical protein